MQLHLSTHLGKESFSTSGDKTKGRISVDVEDVSEESLPLNIVFCIDASGSMSGSKINDARSGILNSLEHLSSDDSFAVVSFDNSATVEVDQTDGESWESAKSDIGSIGAGGGTNIIAGLKESKSQLDSMDSSSISERLLGRNNDKIKWIILLTDGGTSLGRHGSVAENFSEDGVTIHTGGIGNYKKEIVETVSNRSQGEWTHCSSPEEVASWFESQIKSAGNIVATDSILTIKPKNGVNITDFYQSVPQSNEDNITSKSSGYVVDVPDINGETPPEFVFEMSVPSHDSDPNVTVGEATLEVGSKSVSEEIIGAYSDMDLGKNEEVYEEFGITKASIHTENGNPDKASETIKSVEEEIGETSTTSEVKDDLGIIATKSPDSDDRRDAEENITKTIQRKRE